MMVVVVLHGDGAAQPGSGGGFRRPWRCFRKGIPRGGDRCRSAVRKAEARPPAPDPVSQVAADLEARVSSTSGAQSDGAAPTDTDSGGQGGPTRASSGAGRPMPSLQDSPTGTWQVLKKKEAAFSNARARTIPGTNTTSQAENQSAVLRIQALHRAET